MNFFIKIGFVGIMIDQDGGISIDWDSTEINGPPQDEFLRLLYVISLSTIMLVRCFGT